MSHQVIGTYIDDLDRRKTAETVAFGSDGAWSGSQLVVNNTLPLIAAMDETFRPNARLADHHFSLVRPDLRIEFDPADAARICGDIWTA